MRISSSPDDASYSPHMHLCTVYLEGAERNNVELADEAKRFAVQLARNEFGEPVLDKDGRQVRQPFYGPVRIDCPAWIRTAQEHDSQSEDGLGAAIYGMVQTP